MNVLSTASVLPQTPADINHNLLSIVFIGAGKLKLESIRHMIFVFANLNCAFKFLYPEDGILPGLVHNDSDNLGDRKRKAPAAGPPMALNSETEPKHLTAAAASARGKNSRCCQQCFISFQDSEIDPDKVFSEDYLAHQS